MRASIFGNLRSGANSAAGSPIHTPLTGPSSNTPAKVDSNDVEPLALPPSAAPNATTTPTTNNAPRSRPLTRLTPFGRKSSPARDPSSGPSVAPLTTTGSPALTPSSPSLGATVAGGVSYLDSLGLRLGEAVNKALILPAASSHAAGVGAAAGASKAPGVVGVVGVSEGTDAVLKGKRPLPIGRGRALGAIITNELHHASSVLQDSFLHRAILRLLQRPLTVLITNLTQQVTQLLLAPEFTPSVPLVLNATQVHALAYAHFASELLETFDALGLGRVSSRGGAATNDGLRPLKEGLENVVSKVVGPCVGAIKVEVGNVTAELEKESTSTTATSTVDQRFDRTLARVGPLLARCTFAGEPAQSTHVQSVLATFEIGVLWASLVALSNRPLPREEIGAPAREPSPELGLLRRTMSEGRLRTQPSDSSLSTSSSSDESAKTDYGAAQEKRAHQQQLALPSYITPPDTPQMAPIKEKSTSTSTSSTTKSQPHSKSSTMSLSAAVNGLTQWTTNTASPPTSQASSPPRQVTPPSTKKLSIVKLPSLKPLTRAPSPPTVKIAAPTPSSPLRPHVAGAFDHPISATAYKPFILALHALARDAKAVQLSVRRLTLPVEGGLARDAVDEAMRELDGFVGFAEYLAAPDTGSSALLVGGVGEKGPMGVDLDKVMDKTRKAPMLVVLPVLLRVALLSARFDAGPETSNRVPDTVSAWIGLPEDEYRRSCLGGFGKADECAAIVGKAVLKNKRTKVGGGGMGWMREWLERSVREEEEESSSDEEGDGEQGRA
ncbi:hypothetical protein FRB90_001841 [Tulasnella sp. 427]|nr:hypothetical protein FRB90_001841 [Tulasnella sp. 427]